MDTAQLLLSEVQGMRSDFRDVSRELGELATQVKSLVAGQETIRDLERRLTILETQHATTESWVQNARTNTRWLVALAVGSILSVIGLAVTVFLHR